MAFPCIPANLADVSRCYLALTPDYRQAIRIIAYCGILNGTPIAQDIPSQIELAKCFTAVALSDEQRDAIETYLLCQMAQ